MQDSENEFSTTSTFGSGMVDLITRTFRQPYPSSPGEKIKRLLELREAIYGPGPEILSTTLNRRRLLGGAGIALSPLTAGCLDLDSVLGSTRGERELSLSDVGDVGDVHPFRVAVTLQSMAMGVETTPSLKITLEPTADEPLFIGYTEFWPADALLPTRDSDPAALLLLAAGEYSDLTVKEGTCPTTEYRPTQEDGSIGHRVSPDKQYSVKYFVVGSADHLADTCPAPGHYRVRSEYSYAAASEVEEVGWEKADREQFTWGFSLQVADATE